MTSAPPLQNCSLTGGPSISADWIRDIRRDIAAADSSIIYIHDVAEREDGKILYLVQTRYPVAPKFVIGLTSPDFKNVTVLFRCIRKTSADIEWHRIRYGNPSTLPA